MSVYAVDPLVEAYQSLLIDLPEGQLQELLIGGLRRERWSSPPVVLTEPEAPLPTPDIWFLVSLHQLVFAQDVAEQLEPFLSLAGDLLPLRDATGRGRDLRLLAISNVKHLHECIDTSVGHDQRMQLLERLLDQAKHAVSSEEGEALLAEVEAGRDPYPYLAPAFLRDGLGEVPTFFRVEPLGGTIFLLDRDDADDSLLRRATDLNLSGVAFERLWSSETGPRDTNLYRRN